MPINYNNGKIYKIINPQNEIIYIGSTAQKQLCDRFKNHEHRGNGNKIILVENCPCNSREELCMKEQEHIESYDNLLNQFRAFNSEEYNKEYFKEYNNENKKKLSEYGKVYYENNKEKLSENMKIYKIKNKETISEYKKKYREEHKVEISDKTKVKIICECGCEIRKYAILRHRKSQKHIKLMETK